MSTDAKAKKTKAPAAHPPVAQMVNEAIKNLKVRNGSSLPAIKKYINANYKCDAAKLAPFIKKYLKKAVEDGKLVQTKGTGASGSFKLAAKAKEEKPKKAVKKPKAKSTKSPAKPKKAKTPKKKATQKKTKKAAKSPKPKKASKAKSPKPKKAKTPKKSAAKKSKK